MLDDSAEQLHVSSCWILSFFSQGFFMKTTRLPLTDLSAIRGHKHHVTECSLQPLPTLNEYNAASVLAAETETSALSRQFYLLCSL